MSNCTKLNECLAVVSFQHGVDPAKQVGYDFVTVDFVQHFVTSTWVEVMGDVVDASVVIARYEDLYSFKLLAHRIFAARKQVNGQIWEYLAKVHRIGQPTRGSEKRSKGRGPKLRKAKWVVDECVDHCGVPAQPIERRPRRLEGGIQNVCSRRRRTRSAG